MTNTNIGFELIWETAEDLFRDDNSDVSNIINELVGKLTIYKTIASNPDLPADEKQTAKEYLMGKILLTFAHLTRHDKINIYPVLKNAIAAIKTDKLEAILKN